MFELRDLFQWERFITPSIIKLFYWLAVGIAVLAGLSGIGSGVGLLAISPIAGVFMMSRQRARHAGRNHLRAHQRRVHPDRLPHQRASRRDSQSARHVDRAVIPGRPEGPSPEIQR